MEHIILYGSKYGSTRQYAEALSRQTGIPALRYQDAPNLSDKKTIIYLGGLYAGGILGLSKTFRGFSLRDGQRLIIITVGLSDPAHPETRENIRRSLQGQISDQLLRSASVFHLRGGIDYQTLSRGHRLLMSLLFQSVRRTPEENLCGPWFSHTHSAGPASSSRILSMKKRSPEPTGYAEEIYAKKGAGKHV